MDSLCCVDRLPGSELKICPGLCHAKSVRVDAEESSETRNHLLMLSVDMLLRHLGWQEAAGLEGKGLGAAFSGETVSYDPEYMTNGAIKECGSGFSAKS